MDRVRLVSLDTLGAWLLKCHGGTRPPVRQWCVQPSYRTELMAAGQPVVFWVSGDRRRLTPGIWALGELTGPPVLDPPGEHRKLRVPLTLHWLDENARFPRDALLADDRLATLEVLRQPQASNPSFVTKPQWAALRTLIAADT